MKAGGLFCAVVDMYWESPATHQWVASLNVPVQLLKIEDYRSFFQDAGFTNVRDPGVIDPRRCRTITPAAHSRAAKTFVAYREAGSLMITARYEMKMESARGGSSRSWLPVFSASLGAAAALPAPRQAPSQNHVTKSRCGNT
jgi:hypothetical protein